MTHARKSFTLSLTFHTLMGSMAFLVLTQMEHPPKIERIPLKIISMTQEAQRVSITPPQPSISKPIEKPLLQPIQPTPPIPQPIVSKTIAAKPIDTPITSLPQSISVPTPSPIFVAKSTPAVQTITPVPQVLTVPKSEPKPDLSNDKKAFLASLRSSIQNNLRYPSAARRRGMQGEVSVRFTLYPDGKIERISIAKGESVFHNAVQAAVASAEGVGVPKVIAPLFPMDLELTLEFNLNES